MALRPRLCQKKNRWGAQTRKRAELPTRPFFIRYDTAIASGLSVNAGLFYPIEANGQGDCFTQFRGINNV